MQHKIFLIISFSPFLINVNFSCSFSNSLFPRHIIISTLEVFLSSLLHHHPEFNNNHVKARETRKSIKFSFSSPSIAFLCFILLVCVVYSSSYWIASLSFAPMCVHLELSVFFLSAQPQPSKHSFRFINLQPLRRIRRNHKREEKKRRRVTSQGYDGAAIALIGSIIQLST